MLNALTGFIGSRMINTSSASISGLQAARKLQQEANSHEKRGDLDKAKECFEVGIRKTKDLLQRTYNKSELSKTREQLATSYFYYGNFLRECGDRLNAADNYKNALEYAGYLDIEQPEVLVLFNQISIQYDSVLELEKCGSTVQRSINESDRTKESVEHVVNSKLGVMPLQSQIDLSISKKSAQVDYLFEKALSTLGSLKLANKPSMFLVYAHDNPAHGKAEASTSKYLIDKLSQTQVILYSDQTPMGQPYSSVSGYPKKDGRLEDILTNQLCLLPYPLCGDVKRVDKVVVCCSEVLGSYLKWPHFEDFYQTLKKAYLEGREIYIRDGDSKGSSAIREAIEIFSQGEKYKAGFHHVLTEMAFLQIRAEELGDKHGIIPVSLTRNSYDGCLSNFISATTVRLEDIPRFETPAGAGREVYPNQGRHWVLFKLIERLLADSDEAQMFLNKFWQGYSDCISRLQSDSTLDGLEFSKLVDGIFEQMRMTWYSQLAPTMEQLGTRLSDQSRNLTQVQTGVDALVKNLLGNLHENIQRLRTTYLEGLQQDREIKDALANYVSLEGMSLYDSIRFDLESKFQEFLQSDKKVLLLLGEAGSGKSTFNRHLAVGLWDAYMQASATDDSPIPVFIQLSSLPESNRNLVEAFFETQGFSKEHIKALQSKHRFILILDGFDEIKDRQRNFYKDNCLERWQDTKIIISSRPEYLGSNYYYKFHPSGERSALQEYQLATFSEETIERYVDQYKKAHPEGSWSAEQYKKALKQSDLKELVGNPFLLKISLSELPELSEVLQARGQRFTRIALYEQFVKSWFNRSQQRLSQIQLNPEEVREFRSLERKGFTERGVGFSKKLALEMYRVGEVTVTYSAKSDDPWEEPTIEVSHDWRKRLLGDENAMTVLMRLNAPLISQGDQHRFIHKTLQDYFVARALWEEFDVHNKMGLTSWLNRLDIVNDPAVLQFLAERVRQEPKLKNHLLSVLEQSKGEGGVQFERGAANAITALVRAGIQLTRADLKGIRIPGADLSYGMFDSAQLQKADLTVAKLDRSWLRQANLSETQMAGVQFGEWPSLQEESGMLSATYSPDGNRFATGLMNGKISIYQTSNWEKIQTLIGYTDEIDERDDMYSITFNPEGTQLASGSADETVRLWDVETGATLHTFSFDAGWCTALTFNPQGDQLIAGGMDHTVRLWDVKTGDELKTLIGHESAIFSVACHPKNDQLASGDCQTVRLWDVKTGVELHILEGHDSAIIGLAYSLQGDQHASCDDKGKVCLWDVETGAELHTLDLEQEGVNKVVYSPQGDLLLVSGGFDGKAQLWDVKERACLNTFGGHENLVLSVAYSPRGNQLAFGGAGKTMRLSDIKNGTERNIFSEHAEGLVRSVMYSPQGDQLASCSAVGTVQLWDTKTGAKLQDLQGHTDIVFRATYSPQGNQLAACGEGGTVQLWDVKTGTKLKALSGHTGRVYSVKYSPQGGQLASCGEDGTVRLWDISTGTELKVLSGHEKGVDVNAVAYSPQGDQLASCSDDGTVRLRDIKTGVELHILNGNIEEPPITIAYSPKGNLLASVGGFEFEDPTVHLWDTKTGAELLTLTGHTGFVMSLVYSPKGDLLASGGSDFTVRLWDVETGECLKVIQDYALVTSLDWKEISGDQYLAIGGADKTIRQWKVEKEGEEYKEIFCWSTGHDFLTARGALIEGVKGLSEINLKLLKQRGATEFT